MTMRMIPRVVTAALLTATAVLTIGAAIGLSNPNRSEAADRPRFDPTRGVLLSTRDSLKVCVQEDASETRGQAVVRVRAAIARLSLDPRFKAAGYERPAPQVSAGCPQPGRLLASGQTHVKAGGNFASGPEVSNPSPFRLFIYVVSASDIQRMFGSLPFHTAGQEAFCEERQCATMTTALYVDLETVLDPSRLVAEVELGLGLRPAYPADPNGGNTPKKGG